MRAGRLNNCVYLGELFPSFLSTLCELSASGNLISRCFCQKKFIVKYDYVGLFLRSKDSVGLISIVLVTSATYSIDHTTTNYQDARDPVEEERPS